MKWLCIWLIRFYQLFISPLKSRPTCRFTPSCSAYGLEAFRKRGFFVGFYLTVRRILRCNPFNPGGYDPVPERKKRKKKPQTDRNDTVAAPPYPRVCEDFYARRDRHTTVGKTSDSDTTRD